MKDDESEELEADFLDVPGRSQAEIGATIAKSAISYVPVVGSATAGLLELVVGPSLNRRRDRWLQRIGEAIYELRTRLDGFDPRDLEDNEQFISAVLAASPIAVRTHHDEKHEMLRNALVNGVLPNAPDEHEQMIFIRFVDELTPLHVRLLVFLSDPARWFDEHGLERQTYLMAGISTILEIGLPELKDRRETYDQLARDLDQRGLAGGGGLHALMSNDGVWSGRLTPLGQRFLDFITLDRSPAA